MNLQTLQAIKTHNIPFHHRGVGGEQDEEILEVGFMNTPVKYPANTHSVQLMRQDGSQ